MIQWFSMIGSLIKVTAIATLFGVGIRGQLLTAAFAISIPIGILQATSTQNDYVTAFWLLCLAYFIVLSKIRELERLEWLALALAVGLGMLTKGTFYPYALPLLLWYFLPRLKTPGLRRFFQETLLFGAIILLLNIGFWARNISTYGGPLGPSAWIKEQTETSLRPQNWISGVVTKLSLNLVTPWEDVNARITSTVKDLDDALGIEDSRFSMIWSWNHEDLAGNPLHLLSILISISILITINRQRRPTFVFRYALVTLTSFITYAIVVTFDVYGVRYQLPFLMLGAPLIGIAFSQSILQRCGGLISVAFLLLSLPWVLFNSTRPIIGLRPFPEPMTITSARIQTRIGSVFTRSRLDLLFANWLPLRTPITSAAEAIEASDCHNVGLMIDSQHKEYLFLWALDAP
jgi:4-amino-4-deoxy-L-arabinose transferase-like glycosyltransferase